MNQDRKLKLRSFVKKISLEVENYNLLNTAFTHPTYVYEHPKSGLESNQRLEFLGDAVLGMIVAELLFNNYPNKAEGELTKMRATLVCETSLAELALKQNLGKLLLLGRGEEQSGGRERISILADAFEAVIGALFLQNEVSNLKDFIYRLFLPQITMIEEGNYGDYKTTLQELVQKKFEDNITYSIISENGPDHNKSFVAAVIFRGKTISVGQGKSKKEAEQKAAKKALADTSWVEVAYK